MVNPYFCYAFSFSIALLVYLLGWSDLYPRLSGALIVFIVITIGVHVSAGIRMWKDSVFFNPITVQKNLTHLILTVFLYLLWLIEFLYEGGIPLFKILLNQPYNYRLFGVPTLHVFIVTFSSFYTVYLFHLFLSKQRSFIFFLFLINLLAAILIYSRAMLFFNLASCFFLWGFTLKKIPRFAIYSLPAVLVVLFYFFGALGTLRVSREAKKKYDNALFLKIGKADPSFTTSIIPKEYFWPYIYVSSPLANLQRNIDVSPVNPISVRRFAEMVNNEILMDFISKRVNAFFAITRAGEHTIPGPFNVSTVYSRAYSYLGWAGIIVMGLTVVLTPVIYMKILPSNSPFFPTGMAILCTMFLFLAYDNTLRFTGLSFQLVYPVLLHCVCQRNRWFKRIFVTEEVTPY